MNKNTTGGWKGKAFKFTTRYYRGAFANAFAVLVQEAEQDEIASEKEKQSKKERKKVNSLKKAVCNLEHQYVIMHDENAFDGASRAKVLMRAETLGSSPGWASLVLQTKARVK